MMGDWAATPDESCKAGSCLVAAESGNQREQTDSPQSGSQGPPLALTYLPCFWGSGSWVHAFSVYKIRHICGSTEKSDESECA